MATKNLSCRIGALKTDSAMAVIMSMVGGDVTLTCNGVTYPPITMVKIGDDRGSPDPAGENHMAYFATQAITGLEDFSDYEWEVTQGSFSDKGSFKSNTIKKDAKFSLAMTTCFAPSSNDVGGAEGLTAWDFLEWYIDNTEYPMLACLHSDDIYYADGAFTMNGPAENSQGKRESEGIPEFGTRKQYDYALNYSMWFGILTSFYNDTDPNKLTPIADTALSNAFQYCMSKMAFMPQWGDHEFVNDLGWNKLLTTVPNPYHETLNGFDGAGLVVYNSLMLPLQGTALKDLPGANDTVANHWFTDFGCFRYISLDPITRAEPAVTMLGNAQIDDVLEKAAEGNQWFTCISKSADGYPTGFTESSFKYKRNNPIQSEFDRLWVNKAQTPPSLAGIPQTNGNMGTCFMTRGDWHSASWFYRFAPEDGSKFAESIHEVSLMTVDHSSGSSPDWTTADPNLLANDNCELIGATTSLEGHTIKKPRNLRMTIVEVDGSKPTPEIIISQWDLKQEKDGVDQSVHFINKDEPVITDKRGNTWQRLAARKFTRHGGNEGYTLDDEDAYQLPSISGATSGDD